MTQAQLENKAMQEAYKDYHEEDFRAALDCGIFHERAGAENDMMHVGNGWQWMGRDDNGYCTFRRRYYGPNEPQIYIRMSVTA